MIRKILKTVRWIHVAGFWPSEHGLTRELANTLMPKYVSKSSSFDGG